MLLGLNIAMNNQPLMCILDRITDRKEELQSFRCIQMMAVAILVDGLPFD